MKTLIFMILLSSTLAHSKDIALGDYYAPDSILNLLNSSYTSLKNPDCLKDYLKSRDYAHRLQDGGQIRLVNVCSKGSSLRINIRFNQMGSEHGRMQSVNTLVYCDLVKRMPSEGCNDY